MFTFAKVRYRWCRTISTQSDTVKLVTSFKKKRPLSLIWDKCRWAYISDPVETPCGRHSAHLLVDGELYPCDEFTVASGMFEVNIYSKDSSSDEDKQLIASLPSKKIEFILRPADDNDIPTKDTARNKNLSKMKVKSADDLLDSVKNERQTFLVHNDDSGIQSSNIGSSNLLQDFQSFQAESGISPGKFEPAIKDETGERAVKDDSFTNEDENQMSIMQSLKFDGAATAKEVLESDTPGMTQTIIRTSIPLIFTSAETNNPPFYFFGENTFPSLDTMSPFCWSAEKITEIVAEDDKTNIRPQSVSSPRKYIKKSVEVESVPDQTLTSVEKSVAITSNDVAVGSGTERFMELEVTGHQIITNITSVHLKDEAAQTNGDGKDKDYSHSYVQTGNSLGDSVKLKLEGAESRSNTDEDEDKDWLDVEEIEPLDEVPLTEPFDAQLVCNKLNEIILAKAEEEDRGGKIESCTLSSIEEGSVEGTVDSKTDNQYQEKADDECISEMSSDNEGKLVEDQKDYEIEEYMSSPTKMVRRKNVPETKHEESDNAEEPSRVAHQDQESLGSIKERVCERERQVRRLQQEIMLLEDSHRHLHQERAQLLKGTTVQDKKHLMELNEDKQFLSKEVETLRSQVVEQEKANANLEWEVHALRSRLDDNDPAEVSQLIEEMRSLREELITLTKKNGDLYSEIVNLRKENMTLKCSRNLDVGQEDGHDKDGKRDNVAGAKETNRSKEGKESAISYYSHLDNLGEKSVAFERKAPVRYFRGRPSSRIRAVPFTSSDSEGTEYHDFFRKSTMDKTYDGMSTTAVHSLEIDKTSSPCLAESTRIDITSADEALKDTRSCGVQTLITALEADTQTPASNLSEKHPRERLKKQAMLKQLPKRNYSLPSVKQRRPLAATTTTKSSGIESTFSSGSSTDSLLDEADTLIRESMHRLLDGVKDSAPGKSRKLHSKMSKKNVVQSASSGFPAASAPHAGSGDHVRTVSYHASLPQDGPRIPFIPKADSELQEGYLVKFFHPWGGMAHGVVRYVGNLPDSEIASPYVGIELFKPTGDCNGVLRGKQYFQCETNKGLFLPLKKIILAWNENTS